jgi:glycine/D-amino acid oxidase-like deaminating enzyme
VHTGVEVAGLEASDGDLRVHTAGGELSAGAVVLAVNAWTARLLPALPVRAVRAQMLATEPDPAAGRARPAYARGGLDYWRRGPGGRLLVGGRRDAGADTEVGEEDRVTDAVQGALDDLLRDLGAGATRVTHRWSGPMGFTPDGLPLVGPVPGMPGVAVCAGFNGHGMGMAVECARIAAASVAEGARPPAWLDPGRQG